MTRILVADDYGDIRRSLRALLEAEGFEVLEAADGREAVEAYERSVAEGRPIAGAILDHHMPHHKGDVVARLIAEAAAAAGVPRPWMGVYTGSNDASLFSRGAASGLCEYFTKPDGWRGIVDRIVGRPAVARAMTR